MTLERYLKLVGLGCAGVVVLILLFFGGKALWHEATKERPHFNTGKVVQRDYEAAHNESRTRQVYDGEDCYTTGYGDNQRRECSPSYRTEWYSVYVPASWSIQIENCNVFHKDGTQWVDSKTGSNKCFKKWVDVDETTYNRSALDSQFGG